MRNLRVFAGVFVGVLCACGNQAVPVQPAADVDTALTTSACAPAWDSSAVYIAGQQASVNGVNYRANWWTQGDNPATRSGPPGSGQPWTRLGACDSGGGGSSTTSTGGTGGTSGTNSAGSTVTGGGGDTGTAGGGTTGGTGGGTTGGNGAACETPWDSSAVYTSGNTVSYNGVNYTANYWNQGSNPATNSGPAGSGQPWTATGPCGETGTTGTTTGGGSTTGGGTTTGGSTTGGGTTGATTGGSTAGGGTTGGGTTGSIPPAPGFVFSPYKDVTISANWNTSVISTAVTGTLEPVVQAVPNLPTVTWAFATGECGSENWGGISAATLASANVQAWVAAGKKYILSTGGAAGSFTCGSDAGFSAFIDRYASDSLVGIDFDIEAGQTQAVVQDLVARVKAAQANPKYARLRFSFTLATLGGNSPQSLGSMGIMVMGVIKNSGLTNYLVNLMTMDYGAPTPGNCTIRNGACEMGASAVQAAINLNSYYGVPFGQIELTPMIGGNDTQGETFTLADVTTVANFASQKALAGVHFWSLDRDKDCSPGYASPICNSYGQAGTLGFTNAFLNTFQ